MSTVVISAMFSHTALRSKYNRFIYAVDHLSGFLMAGANINVVGWCGILTRPDGSIAVFISLIASYWNKNLSTRRYISTQ